MALFVADRHEALDAATWSEASARAAIAAIAGDAVASFSADDLWPAHPLDEPETPQTRHAMLYFGAGGIIWALLRLRELGLVTDATDWGPTVASLVERNRIQIDAWGENRSSYFMGDSGLLLLQWKLERDAAVADALYRAVEANLRHPTREALWGSPGSIVAAIHMADATGDARWQALIRRAVDILWEGLAWDDELGLWLWTQDMYGERRCYLGAGHGFAGNVYPVLAAAPLLDAQRVQGFLDRALLTLDRTGVREGAGINWRVMALKDTPPNRGFLVQDCHGAPGILCRLAAVPRTPAWDELLTGAAQTTWQAGPLSKGAGLCHGTAGNGYALLKQWQRSGDAVWLERARAFAMHAIGQVERMRAEHGQARHSLWTGDIGVAVFLAACVAGDADLPTLDVF
jgi:hypothetical protein